MKKSYSIALGGVFAALAVVIMTLGGMIPLATYVSPMLCMLLLDFVRKSCGSKLGWTWYAAVCILSVLLSPDKEAAAVFGVMGYYPLIKPKMDHLPVRWLFKGLYFNAVTVLLYWMLLRVIGMPQLISDFEGVGFWGYAAALLLGNACFFLADRLLQKLGMLIRKNR